VITSPPTPLLKGEGNIQVLIYINVIFCFSLISLRRSDHLTPTPLLKGEGSNEFLVIAFHSLSCEEREPEGEVKIRF
jgi:hypothetical protein